MTIYVVMIRDRHTDTEAHLFSTSEKAISFAQSYLVGCGDSAQYVDPKDATMSSKELESAGWLFYTCYSAEGDCVWMLPKEVDNSTVK